MNPQPDDQENAQGSSVSSCPPLRNIHSINPAQLMARIESYESREKKSISDVRRTFCLFVTFDLLFVTLLWIIELNVSSLNIFFVVVTDGRSDELCKPSLNFTKT